MNPKRRPLAGVLVFSTTVAKHGAESPSFRHEGLPQREVAIEVIRPVTGAPKFALRAQGLCESAKNLPALRLSAMLRRS